MSKGLVVKVLWGLVAAGAVVTGSVFTYLYFTSESQQQANPFEHVLGELVPADADLVICATDADSLVEKASEAMTWFEPAADAFGSYMMGKVIPSPFPWWTFLPNPFADLAYAGSKGASGLDFGQVLRQMSKDAGREVREKLIAAGVDASRPYVFFAYWTGDDTLVSQQTHHTGSVKQVPLSWVHCIPVGSGQFSYREFLTIFLPEDQARRIDCRMRMEMIDGYAIVFLNATSHRRYADWRASSPRATMWEKMTAEEREVVADLDLSIHARALAELAAIGLLQSRERTARPNLTSEEIARLQQQIRRDYRSLTLGGKLSPDGLLATLHVGLHSNTRLAQALEESECSLDLIKCLPRRSVFAAQVNCSKGLRRILGRELPEHIGGLNLREMLEHLPEHAAIAVVRPPGLGEILEAAVQREVTGTHTHWGNLRGSPELPMGLVWLTSVRNEGEYRQRRRETGEMIAKIISAVDRKAPLPTVTITPNVTKSVAVPIDRIEVRWPIDNRKPRSRGPSLNRTSAISVLCCCTQFRGQRAAAFVLGSGVEQLLKEMIEAGHGVSTGLVEAQSFRAIEPYIHKQPILLAVGPLVEKTSGMEGFMKEIIAPSGKEAPDDNTGEPQYYTSVLALSKQGSDLRLDIFLSACICKDMIGSLTSGGLRVFDVFLKPF